MTHRWLPLALAASGAAALGLAALIQYVELSMEVGDPGAHVLLRGLGPALVCLAATAVAWLVPAARMAAAGAIIALAAVMGWSVLWGLASSVLNLPVATAIGALLLGAAGVLLVMGPGRRVSG